MKKRILKIAIITMLLIFVYANIVNALSFTATMTSSSTTVPESTEFTITIKISNLDVGPNGINSMSGYLKYDEEIFEEINESSIEGINGWSVNFNSDGGKITLTKGTFVKAEEEVFQVTFKTKSGISGQTGEIKFNNIVSSNSETTISATDVSTKITIGNDTSNTGNTTNSTGNSASLVAKPVAENKTNNTTNNTINNKANYSNEPITSYVNESTEEDIPYTGVEDSIMYIIGGIIIIAIVFYIKFEKINKEIK